MLQNSNRDIVNYNQATPRVRDSIQMMKSNMRDGGYVIKGATSGEGIPSMVTQESNKLLSNF